MRLRRGDGAARHVDRRKFVWRLRELADGTSGARNSGRDACGVDSLPSEPVDLTTKYRIAAQLRADSKRPQHRHAQPNMPARVIVMRRSAPIGWVESAARSRPPTPQRS
jgi:hypothetical protein